MWVSNCTAHSLALLYVCVSGDPASSARDQTGVGMALSMRVECTLLDWIPVDAHLCSTWLDGSISVNRRRLKCRRLFIIYVHGSTDCSSPKSEDEFYRKLSDLLRYVRSVDTAVVAVDFNTQRGCLVMRRYCVDRFSGEHQVTSTHLSLLFAFTALDSD